MSPKRIVERAMKRQLDIIGICDHNSAENVQATINAAKRVGKLIVFGGMEITTAEEVHIISLFDSINSILRLQSTVYAHLPPAKNIADVFGEQIIANEYDEVDGYNTRLLMSATSLSLTDVVQIIQERGGIAIASHVDRNAFSITYQLGFIPTDLPLDAVELSHIALASQSSKTIRGIEGFPSITASDAHALGEIGQGITEFYIAEPTIVEFKKALNAIAGRKITIQV